MHHEPEHPCEPAADLQAADHGDGAAAADRRQRALVAVAEGQARLASQAAQHVLGGVLALLDRRLRHLREPFRAVDEGHIARGEDVGVPRDAQRRVHAHAATPSRRQAEGSADRGGANAGGPDRGAGGDRLAARELDAIRRDPCDRGPGADLDAALEEIAARPLAQAGRERRQQLGSGLEEHEADRVGFDVPVVARYDVTPELGERARHLDARRAAADDDEREEGGARRRILGRLGLLEHPQDMVAEEARVLEIVEPQGRVARPRDAEVLGDSARCHDQVVVGEPVAGGGEEGPGGGVAGDDVRQAELGTRQPAQDAARGIRDLLRLEARDRHLVEERQEAVVVAAVDPEHPHAGPGQATDGTQPGKPRSQDHDPLSGPVRHRSCLALR